MIWQAVKYCSDSLFYDTIVPLGMGLVVSWQGEAYGLQVKRLDQLISDRPERVVKVHLLNQEATEVVLLNHGLQLCNNG